MQPTLDIGPAVPTEEGVPPPPILIRLKYVAIGYDINLLALSPNFNCFPFAIGGTHGSHVPFPNLTSSSRMSTRHKKSREADESRIIKYSLARVRRY